MTHWLINARVYTPYTCVAPATVVIEDGRIVAVGRSDALTPPSGARVTDLRGLWLTPGLIDVHIHGLLGHDVMGEGLVEVARHLPRFGVTAFLPTTLTLPWEEVLARLRRMAQLLDTPLPGAQALGIHVEGPHLSPKRPGMANPRWMRPLTESDWRALQEASCGRIRMLTFAPEEGEAATLIPRLRRDGVIPVIGHSDASFDQVIAWARVGLSMATHTFNAMRGFHHREPGVVGAVLSSPSIVAQIIADGYHVHPAAIALLLRVKGPERVALISDAAPLAGVPPGEYAWNAYRVVVDGQTVRLHDGTLAGAYALLDTGIRTMVHKSGLSFRDALITATATPARVLQVPKGVVRPGYDADLVVWTPDLEVVATLVKGQVVYARQDDERFQEAG